MESSKEDITVMEVAKILAKGKLEGQKGRLPKAEDFYAGINHRDLADARTLFRLIEKLVDEHNTKIRAKITLIEKVRYSASWVKSSLFSDVSGKELRVISKLVSENPEKNEAEILLLFQGIRCEGSVVSYSPPVWDEDSPES